MNGIPRRQIDELIVRRRLSNLLTIVVEGPADKRFLELVQRENYSPRSFTVADVYSIDSFEVDPATLARHGIRDNGARQRVVALSLEVSPYEESVGIRAIIDLDLDQFLGNDLRNSVLMYTDFGCMDAYLWTEDVAKRAAIQFRCEALARSVKRIRELYESVGIVCRMIAAVRAVQAQNPEFELVTHSSDGSLSVQEFSVFLNLEKYIHATKPKKGDRARVMELVNANLGRLNAFDPLVVMNGHDLIWVLSFALKRLTTGSRHLINHDNVTTCLLAHGVKNDELLGRPMFESLLVWATR